MPDPITEWALAHGGPIGGLVLGITLILWVLRWIGPVVDRFIARRQPQMQHNMQDAVATQQLEERRQLTADVRDFHSNMMGQLERSQDQRDSAVRSLAACEAEKDALQDSNQILESRIIRLQHLLTKSGIGECDDG